MTFKQYHDVKEFYAAAYSTLMREEAANLILLGNLVMGNAGADKRGWRDPANWFMATVSVATVSDESSLRLIALMTPPHNLTLYAVSGCEDEAFSCLANGVKAANVHVPGVMAENTAADRFAAAFADKYSTSVLQRIYELTQVNPEISIAGELRLVRESDMAFLPYWAAGFQSECFHVPFDAAAEAEYCLSQIALKQDYVLEVDATPVSKARMVREIQSVCGVGAVFTPPYFRGKGYATSCVAALSKLILARGFTKCVLYTNLANPISNSIYQKIGYRAICDAKAVAFE